MIATSIALCENLSLHTPSKFRLLVVRLGAMGDILHALPAVTALRLAHPEWEIGWVVEPRWQALLTAGNRETRERGNEKTGTEGSGATDSAQPLVDRLHFAPARQWGKRPLSPRTLREIKSLRRELRACSYDAMLDFQGAVRSAAIGRMAGAGRVIGEFQPRERAARWLFSERISTGGAHVIEQDMELARAVAGDRLEPAAPLLPVDPQAEAWLESFSAAQLAAPATAGAGCRIALLTPGAGWGAKRWPIERYAAVARGLAERGLRVLINAGPGEELLADQIRSASAAAATPVCPSLSQLIALTRRIALCIAGDTGPLHLACALGKPVVGIYGPTDPSRNGPYGTRAVVLRSPFSRRDHSRRAEPESGLLTISPEDVLQAADTLLAGENSQA